MNLRQIFFAIVIALASSGVARAKTVAYDLTIEQRPVNMSGKKTVDFAMTVNGGIPGPALYFTEGDDAVIRVHNKMNVETTIHWHGVLLPVEMDGVAPLSFVPIKPGTTFEYRFPIKHAGTYWYHSHTMTQEQQGVLGSLVFYPKKEKIKYDKEAVLVLSDWTDEDPHQVLKNLKKDGDYYLWKKNTLTHWWGAWQEGSTKTYVRNLWARMPAMDLSDVGYDAFLVNGKREILFPEFKKGERVRLRIINAAASTYFYVNIGQQNFEVVSADGMDVKPVSTHELLMGMAETYDVIFTMPEDKSFEVRATAQDISGYASAWLGRGEKEAVPPKAPINPYAHDMLAMEEGGGHGHGAQPQKESTDNPHNAHHEDAPHAGHGEDRQDVGSEHEGHAGHKHGATETAPPAADHAHGAHHGHGGAESVAARPLSYEQLSAVEKTAFPGAAPAVEFRLELDGDMERYLWWINGKILSEDRNIKINKGDVIRFVMVNKSMMHHPMHLHGHFFRVLNGQGDFAPLKHTVDVPPFGERVIEFLANEPGEWFFHCHNLYHMENGMARVVAYNGYQRPPELVAYERRSGLMMDNHWYFAGDAEVYSNYGGLSLRATRGWYDVELEGELPEYDKSQAHGALMGKRWFGKWLYLRAGGEAIHDKGYGVLGVGYVLPLLIEAELNVNHDGELALGLEHEAVLTKHLRFAAKGHWTRDDTDWAAKLSYQFNWHWAAGLRWDKNGAGLGVTANF